MTYNVCVRKANNKYASQKVSVIVKTIGTGLDPVKIRQVIYKLNIKMETRGAVWKVVIQTITTS